MNSLIAASLVVYVTVYLGCSLSVWRWFSRHDPDAGDPLAAALIDLLWPVWLGGLLLWWATRGHLVVPLGMTETIQDHDPEMTSC